jgi:hypothetical protein
MAAVVIRRTRMRKRICPHTDNTNIPMLITNLFKGNFLRPEYLNGTRKRVTIADVEVVNLGQGKDAKDKAVLRMDEVDQGLVLNKTNAEILRAKFGDETDAWVGKQILLAPDTTSFGGKTVACIRVKVPEQKSPAPVAADAEEIA